MPNRHAAARAAWVDALKGAGCTLILWHHFAAYGPMVDAAAPLAPGVFRWLYDYGRMAVQVFLVLGGYLVAQTLVPVHGGHYTRSSLATLLRRYQRLATPLMVALCCAMLAAWVARQWPHPASVPAAPTLAQVLAHLLLLQDVLGQPGLSAGVWYVAIDFQLYAGVVLLVLLARQLARRLPRVAVRHLMWGVVVLMAAVSLCWANRRPALDVTGLYFAGSYALGMLACWTVQARTTRLRRASLAALLLLSVLALALEWRTRIALASAIALLLVIAARRLPGAPLAAAHPRWVERALTALGRRSYSIFLIHYPVLLLFNTAWGQWFPGQAWANAIGLLLAWGVALAAAWWLYATVEARPVSWVRLAWLGAAALGLGVVLQG